MSSKTKKAETTNCKILIWNLLIFSLLFILIGQPIFITCTSYLSICPIIIILGNFIITSILGSFIHEIGHALVIKYINPKIKITISFYKIECNWNLLSNKNIRIIALSGTLFEMLIITIILIILYNTNNDILIIGIQIGGYAQILNFLICDPAKQPTDGYAILFPVKFKEHKNN